MRNVLMVVLAGAMVGVVPRVEAAWVSAGAPVEVVTGWTRIAGHYESAGADPAFRVITRCGEGPGADEHVLDGRVYVAPAARALWLDLPGAPDRLVPAGEPCAAPMLAIEMLVDGTVVASTPLAQREVVAGGLSGALHAPPAAPARPAGRLSIRGQKYGLPFSKRTEAGVDLALDSHVSIELNYERTAQSPMMPFDHDDGFLTRLSVGF